MNGKYTLAEETKTVSGHTLHRVTEGMSLSDMKSCGMPE
jgi:hypothetical protein